MRNYKAIACDSYHQINRNSHLLCQQNLNHFVRRRRC